MTRRFFLITALAAAAVVPLQAQQKGPPPTKFELRMLAFSSDFPYTELYAQDPAAEDQAASVAAPIKGYLNRQSTMVELRSRKLVFTTKPDRESMTRPGELVAEVTLPDKALSAILLFLPGANDGKTSHRVMAIDDSKQAFPAGSLHVTNLSPVPVRLMLENTNYDFTPGKVIVIEKPPIRDDGMCGMRAFAFEESKWHPVATSLWPGPGKGRSVKVLFKDPASGTIQLRAYDDVPPRDRPAEAANAAAPAP